MWFYIEIIWTNECIFYTFMWLLFVSKLKSCFMCEMNIYVLHLVIRFIFGYESCGDFFVGLSCRSKVLIFRALGHLNIYFNNYSSAKLYSKLVLHNPGAETTSTLVYFAYSSDKTIWIGSDFIPIIFINIISGTKV